MPYSVIWELFGDFINQHHSRTLAAFLGDRDAELVLDAESIPFPTSYDIRSDPVFDPDPHRLNLPSGYVETALLVNSLAVWGPDALSLGASLRGGRQCRRGD